MGKKMVDLAILVGRVRYQLSFLEPFSPLCLVKRSRFEANIVGRFGLVPLHFFFNL